MLLSLLLAASSLDPTETPEKYMHGNVGVYVIFVDESQIENKELCGPYNVKGWHTVACYLPDSKTIVMPNPCKYPEVKIKYSFAETMCHELAHAKGWRHPKEKEQP